MFKNLFSGLLTTFLPMLARSALKFVGGAAIAWLAAKHVDPTQANDLVGYASGFLMTGLGIWLSQKNATDGKAQTAVAASVAYDTGQAHAIQQASQAGADVQASSDTRKIAAVSDAMQTAASAAPATKAALLASIKARSF